MGVVIPFPSKTEAPEGELDLLSAIDFAIRDLHDILLRWGDDASRRQAEECRSMLEDAFTAALLRG